jgi:hypothetical protein
VNKHHHLLSLRLTTPLHLSCNLNTMEGHPSVSPHLSIPLRTLPDYNSIAFYQLLSQNILDLLQVSSRSTTISFTVSRGFLFSSQRISVEKNMVFSAHQWTEVEILNLESCTRCAISGKKKDTVSILLVLHRTPEYGPRNRMKYTMLFLAHSQRRFLSLGSQVQAFFPNDFILIF